MHSVKPGVRLTGLAPEMVVAHTIVCSLYSSLTADCVITSGVEGKHSPGSAHYRGHALDFRTRMFKPALTRKEVAEKVQEALGEEFDVVLHDTHMHVEFHPKHGVNLAA